MHPFYARSLCLILLTTVMTVAAGCRAIRRFGDSRQTIDARRLSGQGFQAMHDDRWGIAETLFSDALDVSKTNDRAHWGLAESLWKRGQRDLAIEHMEQAVRLSAGDPRLVQRLGRMYLELGRLEEAEKHSIWALQLQRDSEDVWALRGDCLRASGHDDEALAAYHRALALRPDFPEVQLQAAEIYSADRRFDRVLATLDRLQDGVGVDETLARVDMLQGIAMRQLGRTEEARRCFARAAVKDPDDASPHLEIASLAQQRGEFDAAERSLAVAVRLNPDSLGEGQWLEHLQNQQRSRQAATRPTMSKLPGDGNF
jgi:tetratricopeptide (TPR) repeat protein